MVYVSCATCLEELHGDSVEAAIAGYDDHKAITHPEPVDSALLLREEPYAGSEG